MSDSEAQSIAERSTLGGKSLEVLQRPRYKSWRKKYRKMRVGFDAAFEENKRLFKEEHTLQGVARRLREELDGLREVLLDLNETPQIPASLRYDVRHPDRPPLELANLAADLTPDVAEIMLREAEQNVRSRTMAPRDLNLLQQKIKQVLSLQNVTTLAQLEITVDEPYMDEHTKLPNDMLGDDLPGYLTYEEEMTNLERLDLLLRDRPRLTETASSAQEADKAGTDSTSKDLDRENEILNPMSQYNWLKKHTKQQQDADDTEAAPSDAKPPRKRVAGKTLAKQVGDRAIGRALEGQSPGGASVFDDDELTQSFFEDHPTASSNRKSKKDPDSTYRSKGGRSTSSAAKNKRKRPSGDGFATPTNGSKKTKLSD